LLQAVAADRRVEGDAYLGRVRPGPTAAYIALVDHMGAHLYILVT